jgi:hypothetical protein
MENRNDHDLLVCIEEKLKELKVQFGNHLKHHFAITLVAISAGFIGLVNLTIAMAVIFFRIPK